jgi:hypothetical protein
VADELIGQLCLLPWERKTAGGVIMGYEEMCGLLPEVLIDSPVVLGKKGDIIGHVRVRSYV